MLISCSSHKRFFPNEPLQILMVYGKKKKIRKATCTRCYELILKEVEKNK